MRVLGIFGAGPIILLVVIGILAVSLAFRGGESIVVAVGVALFVLSTISSRLSSRASKRAAALRK